MTAHTDTYHCLNCERPESMAPLVGLRFQNRSYWICSHCLPVLIHKPERLAGKLLGAEELTAAPHEH